MGKGKRWRLRYSFWLDMRRDDERELSKHIDGLKAQRTFTQTVRDGLLLMSALRSGDVGRVFDALSEIAPWFAVWIQQEVDHARQAGQGAMQEDDMRERLAYLEGQIDALKSAPRAAAPTMQALAPPAADDEDDASLVTVTKAKVDGAQIAQNFINSMMRLQQ